MDQEEERAWGTGWHNGFYRVKSIPFYACPVQTRAYYDGKRAGIEALGKHQWFSERNPEPTTRAFVAHDVIEQFRTMIASGTPMKKACKRFKFSGVQGYRIAVGMSYKDAPGPILPSTKRVPRGNYDKAS